MAVHQLQSVLVFEGQPASQKMVEARAKGINIGVLADAFPFALFRAHVRRRSHHKIQIGLVGDRRRQSEVGHFHVPVVTVEDLIALKLRARRNDPTRPFDAADISRLIEYNRDSLDVDYLRQFFRLFDCEDELDDLLKP